MKNLFVAFILFCLIFSVKGQESIWKITDGGDICWEVKPDRYGHHDHIEMSGKRVSTVLRYGVAEDGRFEFSKGMVWPMLRTIPNDTHASLTRRVSWDVMDEVQINKFPFKSERVISITISGELKVKSELVGENGETLKLERTLFPSRELPVFCEGYKITNDGDKEVLIAIPNQRVSTVTENSNGVYGSYEIIYQVERKKPIKLKKGESIEFSASVAAYKKGEERVVIDFSKELASRDRLVKQVRDSLILETPDTTLNTMFNFAKLRGSESIFETKGGPMHGPGGEEYYAAIWANDQAEYINPLFPYIGYDYGNLSALNSYRHFARFMNDRYDPIPSSIIAEGTDIWNGAGDRGDAAMIAYGASRYLLARGDMDEAKELWPLIKWCLEYCKKNINEQGVVSSDTDELEGRFETGDANLSTSCLYFDALISAGYLAIDLKEKTLSKRYHKEAIKLENSIENYFGADVEGYKTYQYYEGNKLLRSWICMPLTVNIFERKDGTIEALFSDKLWTSDGLLTESGSETFWDRSTLYALRGVFASGEVEKGMEFLRYYSNRRMLGDHVPYPVEAYPEGGQRHLSAESGLYCRVFTEGVFGLRPIGMKSFLLTPRFPKEWNSIALRNIMAFGDCFDVEVKRIGGDKLLVKIFNNDKVFLSKKINDGESVKCSI